MELYRMTMICFLISSWCMANVQCTVPAMFVFGDSLMDSGTNNKIDSLLVPKANFFPYGETFFHNATGRFTDGRHVADFIAEFMNLTTPRPFVDLWDSKEFSEGANFASAGSGILDRTNKDKGIISLSQQLRQFKVMQTVMTGKSRTASEVNKLLSESIYLIVSGGNDILGNYLLNPGNVTPQMFISMMAEQYVNSLKDLYKSGARKMVVFGLAPLGCAPGVRAAANITNATCVSAPNEIAQGFNAALQEALGSLRTSLIGSTIIYANTYDRFMELYGESSKTSVVGACCGAGVLNAQVQCGTVSNYTLCSAPSSSLFWDFIHLTESGYRGFAEALWSGDQKHISPVNISSLAKI